MMTVGPIIMVHLLGMFVLYLCWPYMSTEVAVRERMFRRPCPILSNWLKIVTIHPIRPVQIVCAYNVLIVALFTFSPVMVIIEEMTSNPAGSWHSTRSIKSPPGLAQVTIVVDLKTTSFLIYSQRGYN